MYYQHFPSVNIRNAALSKPWPVTKQTWRLDEGTGICLGLPNGNADFIWIPKMTGVSIYIHVLTTITNEI